MQPNSFSLSLAAGCSSSPGGGRNRISAGVVAQMTQGYMSSNPRSATTPGKLRRWQTPCAARLSTKTLLPTFICSIPSGVLLLHESGSSPATEIVQGQVRVLTRRSAPHSATTKTTVSQTIATSMAG
jgi:hypothetical protein